MSSSPSSKSWTLQYVDTVQKEYQKRETHTTDALLAVRRYESAAERKIRQALGVVPALAAPISPPDTDTAAATATATATSGEDGTGR